MIGCHSGTFPPPPKSISGVYKRCKRKVEWYDLLSTYGPRSFAVAGPTIWNNLSEYLRDPELSIDNFRRQLKTFLFAQYWRWHPCALETLVPVRSINLLFTLHYDQPTLRQLRSCYWFLLLLLICQSPLIISRVALQVRTTYSARTCVYIRRPGSLAATYERWPTATFTTFSEKTFWRYSTSIQSLPLTSPATYKLHSS